MHRSAQIIALELALLLMAATGHAQSTQEVVSVYTVAEDSAWLEGCIIGPCDCLVALFDDLSGNFQLVELQTFQPGPRRLFDVRDLHWTLRRGDAAVVIRGSGIYHTSAPVLDEQRLVLQLEFDGDPIGTLDSGEVAGSLSFPEINILALTSGECIQEGHRENIQKFIGRSRK